LGVSRASVKPVWNGKKFKPRTMLPFSLAYDHRAVNGIDAGMFCTTLGQLLSDIRLLVLCAATACGAPQASQASCPSVGQGSPLVPPLCIEWPQVPGGTGAPP